MKTHRIVLNVIAFFVIVIALGWMAINLPYQWNF